MVELTMLLGVVLTLGIGETLRRVRCLEEKLAKVAISQATITEQVSSINLRLNHLGDAITEVRDRIP